VPSSPHLSPASAPSTAPVAASSARRLPAAVLWDMDGTLINSEPYWMAAEGELTREHGVPWTHEDGLQLVGRALVDSAAIMQRAGVRLEIPEIVDYLITRVIAQVEIEVPWQDGAVEVLAAVRELGVPCALVTMSYRSFADAFVAQAAPGTFDVTVTGDEVSQGKPHPEAYLRAAEMLGVPIEDCLVVEDSPSGIASGLASGATTVGIEVMVPVEPQPGLSRIRSLRTLTSETLGRLVAGEVLDELGSPQGAQV
jgi:HAD superfamily hydrolase (TIGR01509 family)